MKTPRKAVVSKRVSEEEKLNASRWSAFIKASGTPFLSLSNEWLMFFDSQANIETAETELVRLIDIAIAKDEKK
jgi:hypothetical protein